MNAIQTLLTDHIDIWTAADTAKKSGRGRASSNASSVYGVRKLRELILELAVRGKLVPQDANDEPVTELLKRIQVEKNRLIAEGKIKKERIPVAPHFAKGGLGGISEDEKPFGLPQGWEFVRLGFIGYTQTGTTPNKSKPESFGFDVPFIKPGDIYPNFVEYENEGLSFSGAEQSGRVAYAGSLLMVCIGTIGKCNLIERECSFNQQINSITPYAFDSQYLLAVCRSFYFQNEAWSRSSSTTIPILNKGNWEEICIPVPPYDEQHRIVAKVDELMALCDQLETQHNNAAEAHEKLVSHLLGTLTQSQSAADFSANWQRIAAHFDTLFTTESSIEALKQTLLQLAVMGKLVPQDPKDEPASELLKRIQAEKAKLIAEGRIKKDKPLPPITDEEIPFVLPQGWEWVRFNDLINPAYLISYGVLVPGGDEKDGIPFVRIADLDIENPPEKPEKSISREIDSQYERTRLEGGEILMGVVGSIGKLGVAPLSWKGANIARAICRIKASDSLSKNYLVLLLQSRFMQNNFIGDTKTLAQPTLNIGLIRLSLTPLPPFEEEIRIVAKVDELFALCDQLKSRITQANQLQQKLADVMVEEAI